MTVADLARTPASRPTAPTHEHGWRVESQHPTSEGIVLYVRCDCGVRRVDRLGDALGVPAPTSREIPLPGRCLPSGLNLCEP